MDALTVWLSDIGHAFDRGERPTEVTGPFGTHGITYGEDEDGKQYATVGFNLPFSGFVFAEIEDGTYGELQGLRIYLPEDL